MNITKNERDAVELSAMALRLLALCDMHSIAVVSDAATYVEQEGGAAGKTLAALMIDPCLSG